MIYYPIFLCAFTNRLLRNLTNVIGISNTPILISVDGFNEQTIHLLNVLQKEEELFYSENHKSNKIVKSKDIFKSIHFIIHRPQGEKSTNALINSNVRFALDEAMKKFGMSKNFILLEDDLLVSPDFIR